MIFVSSELRGFGLKWGITRWDYPAWYKSWLWQTLYSLLFCSDFYLQDKENENVYIATPVWIFSQVLDVDASDELSYPQQIFIINAMDGSIVYLQDER
jgi:hypothetical protein